MSHILKATIPVKLKDRDCLVRAFGLKELQFEQTSYGYDVAIPGCNERDVTSSLRADKKARLLVKWNDKSQEYEIHGEAYRIQQQYAETMNKVVSGYQVAITEAAFRAVYPQVYVVPQANGQMQVQGVSY